MRKAGADYKGNGQASFCVWAPEKKSMILHIVHPREQKITMQKDEDGFFYVELSDIEPGLKYFYMPDGVKDYPDPASRYQPEGVHGASGLVDHQAFTFQQTGWRGIPFNELVFYELHIGTFTEEGTFEAVIPRLKELADLGINAIEIMPVAQFPGSRNWGYDGVFPYAVQNSYGGPEGLKKLVDACHAHGIAVFLDVVYNHLGPEGNYFGSFSPYYFNSGYHVFWGDAINFDGPGSDAVRDYYSDNLLYWFEHYRIDGLRVDAIHTMYDNGAVHFWKMAYHKVRQLEQKLGRVLYTVAESDSNNPAVVQPPQLGGYGFNAQWLDDFHHSLYVQLDKNGIKRYEDFGRLEQLIKAYKEGFVHSGEYVKFRKRRHGASSAGLPGHHFVVFNQNHDQIGNRVQGERLSVLVNFEQLKIAAAAILLSPYIPFLFMGEEYAEEAPFHFFVSHSDKELIEKVKEGRRKEFEKHIEQGQDFPDPQSDDAFHASRLRWHLRNEGKYRIMLQWHKQLIGLRRSQAALRNFNKNDIRVQIAGRTAFLLHRCDENGERPVCCFFNLGEEKQAAILPEGTGKWIKELDSKEPQWMTEKNEAVLPTALDPEQDILLPPYSVVLYRLEKDV